MHSLSSVLSYLLTGFGRLFYLVSPWASTFDHYEDVPDYIAESIPFFTMTIVLEFLTLLFSNKGKGLLKQQTWGSHRYALNDMVGSIGSGMLQTLSRYFLYNLTLNSYLYVYQNFRVVTLDPNHLGLWIAGFFIIDLGYYWFHRAAHEINLFWATHVVHHSSEYYNQTTALRQSIFQPYCSWLFDLPAALFLPPSLFVAHKQFNTLFQYWIHTEVVGNLGPLEYIINTPSAHRVHHGRNPYCIDKNYAGTLIIWDILFGTFELERVEPHVKESKDVAPVAYGLTHPIDTFDPFTVQFHHLSHVLRTCYTTSGWSNKLKVLFYGPGWHQGTPRTGLLEEIPPIATDQPPAKYDPPVSLAINAYVLVHFVGLIMASGIFFNLKPSTVPALSLYLVTIYIFGTLTSFGWLFDHKPWAVQTECGRCLILCLLLKVAEHHGIMGSAWTTPLQAMHLVSGLCILAARHTPKTHAKSE
ncbi:alkylglycerol monooxygenase-like protein [Radiomyces spectabilis]|uniref:alkylglycerol monooxygenase-like protein n=1 Tax=Radiomyces spectabilis TaxID=64574 RepID=UPI002220ED1E|nr:alkylglycerol monooxygenase-like protein [Radiomyces spectabilis]KAI8365227.1 alkylglycerol monooxygenase-like protein [Radiomyces spectabilis]